MKMKYCPDCMTEKSIEKFGNNRSRKDGYHPSCKVCANGRLKNYRANGLISTTAYDLNLMTNFLRMA